ncbi:MAG: DUF6033 family protein [Lachnospiraceae bacterium]|nr:DUF6033 family protein [Lachnospiraceae bacterium]
MTSVNGALSAYQQANSYSSSSSAATARAGGAASSAKGQDNPVKEQTGQKVETKGWSPIESGSSLIPHKTEYGYTIGDVQLSDKAKAYYDTLKSKFHNMEFIAVSKDMKDQVKQNAAAYGNANKMVVLIDDEKLERMAEDEEYRKKYEGIIAMAQNKLTEAKNSLASTGAGIKNFGMSVDSNGNEKFFAVVEKATDMQKKRIEKKAAEKKELKAKEEKKAKKEETEERLEKAREKKAEAEEERAEEAEEEKEYVTIEAGSLDELISKLQDHSYSVSAGRVRTEAELAVGGNFDYRG